MPSSTYRGILLRCIICCCMLLMLLMSELRKDGKAALYSVKGVRLKEKRLHWSVGMTGEDSGKNR